MRALLAIVAFAFSISAMASPIQRTDATKPTFQFKAESLCKGCVSFSGYNVDDAFPRYPSATVTKIRFYVGFSSFADVTQQSLYVEEAVMSDQNGYYLPTFGFGNIPSGTHAYFKIGFADDSGKVFFFTPDSQVDPNTNSVIVK